MSVDDFADLLSTTTAQIENYENGNEEIPSEVGRFLIKLTFRVPGMDFKGAANCRIQAIKRYRNDYELKNGKKPVGEHLVEYELVSTQKTMFNLTPCN